MPPHSNFVIRSTGDPRFTIRLADCTREHADSVLASVTRPDFNGPHDLQLDEVTHLYLAAEAAPVKRRRFWRRSG